MVACFTANSFENCCEQKTMEGSNLILKSSFAHSESTFMALVLCWLGAGAAWAKDM